MSGHADRIRELRPLYICSHTKGLLSPEKCPSGCQGQVGMLREPDVYDALAELDDALAELERELDDYRREAAEQFEKHHRAERELEEARRQRRHYVSAQSTPGDPVGHDGWECEPGCDACAFAREASELRKRAGAAEAKLAETQEALRGPFVIELAIEGQVVTWSQMFANEEHTFRIAASLDYLAALASGDTEETT